MPINALNFSSFLRLSLTVVAWACLALRTVLAQENAVNPTTSETAAVAKLDSKPNAEFEASRKALLEHLKVMRALQVEYHLSESNASDKKFRQQWSELCDAGRPLFAKSLKLMVEKALQDPKANAETVAVLIKLMVVYMKDSRFEDMPEILLALQEKGFSSDEFPEMIALSAFANNQFDVAKEWMEKHFAAKPSPLPMLAAVYPQIDELRKEWAEELRWREEDAKGEPLPQVSIRTTKGEVVVELFENQAPETVGNFVHLVEQGFYDGLQFHRVLEHFMAQTGCPENDGTGGPGYMIRSEAKKPNARKFFRGSLGVALSAGNMDSGGSQFFITFIPTFNLNGTYTVFGRVISGIEVIGNITQVNPDDKKDKEDEGPKVLDEIIEAKVLRKRNHEYLPNKVPQ